MAVVQPMATVLFIGDDPEARADTITALARAGYAVTEAGVEEARACLVELPVDVILLDLAESALAEEMARQLKTACLAPFIPVLRLTQVPEEGRPLDEGLEASAETFLGKPVAPDVLLSTVSTLVRLGRAYREAERERGELEEVLRQMPSGVIIADATGELHLTNDRAKEILCLTGILRSTSERVRALRPVHGGVRSSIEGWPLRRALHTGERVIGEEFEIACGDGRSIVARVSAGPIRNAEGQIVAGVLTFTDDTPRKQLEEALREREAALAQEAEGLARLLEAGSRLWQTQDLHEGLEEMLSATIELLGADKGNIQLLDTDAGVLRIAAQRGFGPEFLEAYREISARAGTACGRALRSGQRVVVEDVEADEAFAPWREAAQAAGYRAVQSTPLAGRDGTLLGVLSTHFGSPHRPSESELHRLDLYVRQAADFIERYRIEEALRESRALLDTAVESTDHWLAYLDADLRFVWANSALARAAGRSPKATARQAFTDVLTHAQHLQGTLRRVLASGRQARFQALPLALGSGATKHWVRLSLSLLPVPDAAGRPQGVVLSAHDISVEVQQREEIAVQRRSSQEQAGFLAALLDNAPVAMAYLDTDLRFVRVNRTYAEWAGLSDEELTGRTHFEIWGAAERVETMRQALATGEPVRRTEAPITYPRRLRRPQGYVDYAAFPVRDEAGAVVGLVLTAEDVTDRRHQREERLAAERSRAELAETLNAEVNHRVKNNLAMAAGMLQMQSAEERDPRVATVLNDAASRLVVLATIHEQLQADPEGRVDLLTAIRRLIEATRNGMQTRGIDVTAEGDPAAIPAREATNLLIVINELITNAVKYCDPVEPAGGRDCAVRVGVKVGSGGEGGGLVLSVWNSGNPVPEGFDTSRAAGLGLRLVRALIVEQCGGTFSLRPQEGGTLAEAVLNQSQLGVRCGR